MPPQQDAGGPCHVPPQRVEKDPDKNSLIRNIKNLVSKKIKNFYKIKDRHLGNVFERKDAIDFADEDEEISRSLINSNGEFFQ